MDGTAQQLLHLALNVFGAANTVAAGNHCAFKYCDQPVAIFIGRDAPGGNPGVPQLSGQDCGQRIHPLDCPSTAGHKSGLNDGVRAANRNDVHGLLPSELAGFAHVSGEAA